MTVNRKPNGKFNFSCPKCGYTETNIPNKSVAEGKQSDHKQKGCSNGGTKR
jgi:hypothetical protein